MSADFSLSVFSSTFFRAVLPERSSYALALGTTLVVGGRIEEGIEHLEDALEAAFPILFQDPRETYLRSFRRPDETQRQLITATLVRAPAT